MPSQSILYSLSDVGLSSGVQQSWWILYSCRIAMVQFGHRLLLRTACRLVFGLAYPAKVIVSAGICFWRRHCWDCRLWGEGAACRKRWVKCLSWGGPFRVVAVQFDSSCRFCVRASHQKSDGFIRTTAHRTTVLRIYAALLIPNYKKHPFDLMNVSAKMTWLRCLLRAS
jgi:hypothetical protein